MSDVLSMQVDPVSCDGRGLCAELLPEVISLDEWGFPIIRHERFHASLEQAARRAVAACPVLALRLSRESAA